jgi:hypothetical protein
MVDEKPEIRFHPLVVSFRLSIRSWVICGRDVLLYGKQATQLLCEPRREPWVAIAYDFGG